jgi:hypothetical protein
MADAVSVLRQEIMKLEQELAKRRNALTVLTGAAATRAAVAAKKSPATAKAPARPASKAPSRPASKAPSLAQKIMSYMTTNRGKLFSPAEITEALGKSDKTVSRDNVQRRLGELVKRQNLRREEGRYGVA